MIENKSPLKQTLQLFASKAHYKQETDSSVMTNELNNFFKKLADTNIALGYSYENIPEICDYDAERYTQMIFQQEATMMEKVMLKKFFFMKEFTVEAKEQKLQMSNGFYEENTMSYIWNENFCFF